MAWRDNVSQRTSRQTDASLQTHEQIAHVLTYVRNAWGNTGDIVTVEEVQKVHPESVNQ